MDFIEIYDKSDVFCWSLCIFCYKWFCLY